MTRYHGRARNALARTLDAPAVRVRPWGRLAWLVIVVLAAALAFACVEQKWDPVDQGHWQQNLGTDGGVR